MVNIRGVFNNVIYGTSRREIKAGVVNRAIQFFSIAVCLYFLLVLSVWWGIFPAETHSVIALTIFLVLGFVVYSPTQNKATRISWLDLLLILLSLSVGVYFCLSASRILERTWVVATPLSGMDIAMAVAFFLLIFEATRRAVGLLFVGIILFFLGIMYFGPYLPGVFVHNGFSFTEIMDNLVWTDNQGLWGIPMQIAGTYIVLFLVFGGLMRYAGVGKLLVSLSGVIAGGARGGPAKVAVLGSGFVGSITAGPVSNVVMTGTFTIPMMKKIGYKPAYAGAVEATASAGSGLVPPVMAAIVFIMAELTGIPLIRLMIIAAVPAIFYYLCILLQVHFQALRLGIGRGQEGTIKQVPRLLKEQGHLLLPLVVLVGLLIAGWHPLRAVIWAILAVVVAAAFRKETRMGARRLAAVFHDVARELPLIGLVCALSGTILIALFHTGISGKFSHVIATTGGSLLFTCVIGGLVCIILGMGIPPIAAYLVTVLIVAPIMIESGVPIIVAHFFSLYYSNIAFITPPIAIGAFIAASVAGANFWDVGFRAVRLGAVGFVIPILMVYRPGILMFGTSGQIIWDIFSCLIMTLCLASAFEGWQIMKLNPIQRAVLLVAAILIVPPYLTLNIGAIAIAGLILLWQLYRRRNLQQITLPEREDLVKDRE